MKRSLMWTIALAVMILLTTGVWTQHGGGAAGHGGPPSLPAHGQSHAEETAPTTAPPVRAMLDGLSR